MWVNFVICFSVNSSFGLLKNNSFVFLPYIVRTLLQIQIPHTIQLVGRFTNHKLQVNHLFLSFHFMPFISNFYKNLGLLARF